jgi:hypothetical protein
LYLCKPTSKKQIREEQGKSVEISVIGFRRLGLADGEKFVLGISKQMFRF